MADAKDREPRGSLVNESACELCFSQAAKCLRPACGHVVCLDCVAKRTVLRHTPRDSQGFDNAECPVCDLTSKLDLMASIALEAFVVTETSALSLDGSAIFDVPKKATFDQRSIDNNISGLINLRETDLSIDREAVLNGPSQSRHSHIRLLVERRLSEASALLDLAQQKKRAISDHQSYLKKSLDERFAELIEKVTQKKLEIFAELDERNRSRAEEAEKRRAGAMELCEQLAAIKKSLERGVGDEEAREIHSNVMGITTRISNLTVERRTGEEEGMLAGLQEAKAAIEALSWRQSFASDLLSRNKISNVRPTSREPPAVQNTGRISTLEQSSTINKTQEKSFHIEDWMKDWKGSRSRFNSTKLSPQVGGLPTYVTPKAIEGRENSILDKKIYTIPRQNSRFETLPSPSRVEQPNHVVGLLRHQRALFLAKK
eukprot:TRINITY_DN5574_c0_g1_i2.p1 TRINITY_DN5574_c0_g1~~TRINITY_DN5574_c0_g1_i2.p1  ORF type:complete len:431 (-),score=81.63 TRINITY_DN5574_c0_g1_i2:38-1330(-)